jgi:hypothetical protein
MAVSFDIDPNDPKTWVNHPAPALDAAYSEELERIGGLNPYGQPVLRFVWGQERRWFFSGEQRIRYTDDRLEPNITRTPDTFAVKNRETGERIPLDSYADMLNYDERAWERILTRGESRAEFIGQPLWFVEQWKPPELIDSPARWNLNRYGDFEDPATGVTLRHIDQLGDYPSEGRYEAFFVVGSWDGKSRDPFNGKVLKYRPVGWDVIEHIRRKWHAREHEKLPSVEQMFTDRWDEQEAKEAKLKADLADRIRQELLPHKHRFLEFGSRVSVPSNFKPRRKAV